MAGLPPSEAATSTSAAATTPPTSADGGGGGDWPPPLRDATTTALAAGSSLTEVWEAGGVRVLCATWNMFGKPPPAATDALQPLLQVGSHHIVAVGTQECERSIASSVVLSSSKALWERTLDAAMGPWFRRVAGQTLAALHLAVYAHHSLMPVISDVQQTYVPCGIGNALGNKGGVAVGFNVGKTALLFVNVHLAAHHHRVEARNRDFKRIQRAMPLIPAGYGLEARLAVSVESRRLMQQLLVESMRSQRSRSGRGGAGGTSTLASRTTHSGSHGSSSGAPASPAGSSASPAAGAGSEAAGLLGTSPDAAKAATDDDRPDDDDEDDGDGDFTVGAGSPPNPISVAHAAAGTMLRHGTHEPAPPSPSTPALEVRASPTPTPTPSPAATGAVDWAGGRHRQQPSHVGFSTARAPAASAASSAHPVATVPANVTDRYDRVFFIGDMNYRIEGSREEIETAILEGNHGELLARDQLTVCRSAGSVARGFQEGPLHFRPTYKLDRDSDAYDTGPRRRIPAWTDRILFKANGDGDGTPPIRLLSYDAITSLRTSDHRPVVATFFVSLRGSHVRRVSVGGGGDATVTAAYTGTLSPAWASPTASAAASAAASAPHRHGHAPTSAAASKHLGGAAGSAGAAPEPHTSGMFARLFGRPTRIAPEPLPASAGAGAHAATRPTSHCIVQ